MQINLSKVGKDRFLNPAVVAQCVRPSSSKQARSVICLLGPVSTSLSKIGGTDGRTDGRTDAVTGRTH